MSILITDQPVILIGAAPIDCLNLISQYPFEIIAVDGGANNTLSENKKFKLILGDMDSCNSINSCQINEGSIYKIDDQDTTDFDKALKYIKAPLYLAIGFYGARIDHTLSSFQTLSKNDNIILIGPDDFAFKLGKSFKMHLPINTRISFFAFEKTRVISSIGLKWSLTNLSLTPNKQMSISNRTSTSTIEVKFDQEGIICILPLDQLDTIINYLF